MFTDMTANDKRLNRYAGKTAIARNKLSRPVRYLIDEGLLLKTDRILDYGCGKGGDVKRLNEMGYTVVGYDPHQPEYSEKPTGYFDVIMSNYVLNVSANDEEATSMLIEKCLLAARNARIYTAVRRDIYEDSFNDKRKTWQRVVDVSKLAQGFESIKKYSNGFELYEYCYES